MAKVETIVFLSLVLDLFAFTIPLPLFPRIIEWYTIVSDLSKLIYSNNQTMTHLLSAKAHFPTGFSQEPSNSYRSLEDSYTSQQSTLKDGISFYSVSKMVIIRGRPRY